jgi:hypothetical protein
MSRSSTRRQPCPSWATLCEEPAGGSDRLAEHLAECEACRGRQGLLLELWTWLPERGGAAEAIADCPDVERWVLLASGEVSALQRRELVGHLAACGECAALWRELVDRIGDLKPVDLELREGIGDDPAAEGSGGAGYLPARSGWSRVAVRAAAALVGVALLVLLVAGPFPPIDSGGEGRWRGPAPRIGTTLDWAAEAPAPTLRWEQYPDAVGYRLRVWNEAGELLVERTLAAEVTAWLLENPGVDPGAELLWSVEAMRGGEVVASASLARFRWRSP